LDAATGKQVWHFEGLHIDATPLVHDGVLYVGSYWADDNEHKDLRLVALKVADGTVVWNEPIDLSSFSQPAIVDKTLYFSLGTGDLESDSQKPAGAVVAVNAETGKQVWRTDLPNGVFGSPTHISDTMLVTCRNGTVCALRQSDGLIQWQFDLGGPAIASPSIADNHSGSFVLLVSRAGRCVKLNVWNGSILDDINLVRAANADSGQFFSAPASHYLRWGGKRIYIAGSVTRGMHETPVLFCLPSNY
jgi:outer membrane protein assembly factor BamB